MAAPILLSEYKMKKKAAKLKREAEAPVTLEFMREFRAEMMSQFATIDARFKQVDAKFDEMRAQFSEVRAQISEVRAQISEVRAQITQVSAETKTSIHQVKLLVEEQNLRNKPECLED